MSVPTPILQYNLSDATMKGLLPAGYTPLAYIESSGTLWINSGIALNETTSTYTFSCRIGASTRDGHAHSFFGMSSYLTGMMGIYHYTNNNYYAFYIKGLAKSPTNYVISKGNIFDFYLKMDLSNNTYESKIDKDTLKSGSFNAMTDTTTTIRVFKSDDFSGGYWKCYYFRIAKDNVLQVDLHPARRDSDGVIGMYDLVSRTFKTNSGSGTFIAGPELAVGKGGGQSLPEEYLLVEYLYNEDKTSWINFNRTLKSNTIMKVNMQVVSYSTGAVYQQVMGYATNTTWKPYSLGLYNNAFILYSGTVDSTALPTSSFRQVIWTNSEETAETSGSTLGLFHMAGSPGNYANAGIKVQCCQILEGSSIIIKAFPCYRKSDMKPGMYDVINRVFYTNAGTGEFILGPTITNYYSCEVNAVGENMWPETPSLTHNRGGFTKTSYGCYTITGNSRGSYTRFYNLGFNYKPGPWTISFDAYATANTTVALDICDCGGKTITITPTKQRFYVTATAADYYSPDRYYNGFFDIEGTITGTIYISNLCMMLGDRGTTYSPYKTDGLYTNLSGIYDSSKGWVADFGPSGGTPRMKVPVFPSGLSNCSIAFWHKNVGNNVLWLPFTGLSNSYYLAAQYNGVSATYHSNAGSPTLYQDGVLTTLFSMDTNWHFFVISGANLSSWTQFHVNNYGGSWSGGGLYSNIMIFNTALTAAQVKELYGG